MDLMLTGRVVMITGAGKGMGPAIARGFAREGAVPVLLGRDLETLGTLSAELEAAGSRNSVLSCDVTRPEDAEHAVAATERVHGRVDALLNVAGGTGPVGKPGCETSRDEFSAILELNLTGCFNMMRAVLPGMVERRYGKIVNVGGTFGLRGRSGRMAYSASKWGLRGVTKSTAIEAGPYGINVNYVAPGMVNGPRFRERVMPQVAMTRGITEDEAIAEHASEYALRRISTADDVAAACLFLTSDVSRQITGVDLPVDGGWAAL